jgi:hypothetical protein
MICVCVASATAMIFVCPEVSLLGAEYGIQCC